MTFDARKLLEDAARVARDAWGKSIGRIKALALARFLVSHQELADKAVKGLAVVGFFAILVFGTWGSVAVVRNFPAIVSTMLTAAVSLSSIFIPAESGNADLEKKAAAPEEKEAPAEAAASRAAFEPSARESALSVYPLGASAPAASGTGVDLAVRIIAVGTINVATNEFAPLSPLKTSAERKAAVHFAVENLGTERSPAWRFNASLPTIPAYVFSSEAQQALNPGDRIEFTMGFDNAASDETGVNSLTITVDPGAGSEVTKENNVAKQEIRFAY